MLIKNLENIELKKAIKEKTRTGNVIIAGYDLVKKYRIQEQILQEQIT